jgi:hypothetical protein
MAHDVFISYCSSDKDVAEVVCAGLEGRGISCWIAPRDILPGLTWGSAIVDAITEARVMVLICSSETNKSEQVEREVERAAAKRVRTIPFRIEDVPLSKTLEYFISTSHWFNALTRPIQPHVDRLADTITTLLARPSRARPGAQRAAAPGASPSAGSAAAARAYAPVPVPALTPVPEASAPPAPARKGLPKAAIAAGIALALIAAALLLSSARSAPQVLSVQFPAAIVAGQRGDGAIFFRDKKGNVARARVDVVQASAFQPFAFETPALAGKTSGSVGFWLVSPAPQHVVLQAVLIDSAGHESNPVAFAFDVRPAPAAAPRTAPKKSQRGFEVQAPNGFRFKVR